MIQSFCETNGRRAYEEGPRSLSNHPIAAFKISEDVSFVTTGILKSEKC